MKGRTITGNCQVSQIIQLLDGKTRQGRYNEVMYTFLINMIQKDSESISIPTVAFFADICPEFRQDMLNLYNSTFGLIKGVAEVPETIKVLQGSILDGFCYGYDVNKEESKVYSMRVDLFGDELEEKDLVKIMESNLKGEIKALKLSYEYLNCSNVAVDFKWGAHRTVIDDENCVLVPMIACTNLLKILSVFMKQKLVIKTSQVVANGEKIRCVTEDEAKLAHYCDNPQSVQGMTSLYYPLDAFFYAPCLGAPSTTSQMTLIDLFRLSGLTRITNAKQLSQYGIEHKQIPSFSFVKEIVAVNSLLTLATEDNTAFEDTIAKFPKQELLGDMNRENVTSGMITRYMHTLKESDEDKVLKAIPGGVKKYQSLQLVYKGAVTPATEEQLNDFYNLSRNNILRVVIRKKDGTFSSFYCTNNNDILKQVYGEGYFATYESFGVRAKALMEAVASGGRITRKSLEAHLNEYGFGDVDMESLLYTSKNYSTKLSPDSIYNALYDVTETAHYTPKNTGETVYLVRGLEGRIDNKTGKALEYYKNVDLAKIQKVFVIDSWAK